MIEKFYIQKSGVPTVIAIIPSKVNYVKFNARNNVNVHINGIGWVDLTTFDEVTQFLTGMGENWTNPFSQPQG